MITSLYIAGVSDLYATSIELDTLVYPLQKFGWVYESTKNNFPKSNSSGSWPTRSRVTTLTIEMNGEILASSTSEFWTRRKALMAKVIPPPADSPYPEYDHTRFIATFDGDATTYYIDGTLQSNIGALEATGSPTVQAFQLMFSCAAGYWSAGLGGSRVII